MEVQIKPVIQYKSNCPYCGAHLEVENTLWQGMHVCVKTKCISCKALLISDLKVGHAVTMPYQVDCEKGLVFGSENSKSWLGEPLLKSLREPQDEKAEIIKEVFKDCKRVIILNCIDYLYGHCLLKLLNAERHLERDSNYGIIVIVQKFLRWMVPDGVAEVWTVDIPLRKGRCFYPNLNQFVQNEFSRFDELYVSRAYSHPSQFDITKFSGVPKHQFEKEDFRITFIWREDRVWCNLIIRRIFRSLGIPDLALLLQSWRLRQLFNKIRHKIPAARFTVTGLGKKYKFPEWIEDMRVEKFDAQTEKNLCGIYSDSRLIIGVHGSNMLLPSAHAGMTIDLMLNGKEGRWGNFAQDIIYQELNPRLASFRYRYISFETSIRELSLMSISMLENYSEFYFQMTSDSQKK